jgi:hypothetical protein
MTYKMDKTPRDSRRCRTSCGPRFAAAANGPRWWEGANVGEHCVRTIGIFIFNYILIKHFWLIYFKIIYFLFLFCRGEILINFLSFLLKSSFRFLSFFSHISHKYYVWP